MRRDGNSSARKKRGFVHDHVHDHVHVGSKRNGGVAIGDNDWPLPVIGITGSIASGKSTVARLLAARGACVVDADRLLRLVTRRGSPAWRGIVRAFGDGVTGPGGGIDRQALARVVFADERKRALLERLTHGAIMAAAGRRIAREARARFAPVFLEAALLVESGLARKLDGLVAVVCDPARQVERLARDRGMTAGEARRRLRAQLPARKKAAAADWVVGNDGTPAALAARVEEVWREIVSSDVYARKRRRFCPGLTSSPSRAGGGQGRTRPLPARRPR